MLTLVRDTETAQDVAARLAAQALTVAEIAGSPIQHVPSSFLAAVAGLFPELLVDEQPRQRGLAAL